MVCSLLLLSLTFLYSSHETQTTHWNMPSNLSDGPGDDESGKRKRGGERRGRERRGGEKIIVKVSLLHE